MFIKLPEMGVACVIPNFETVKMLREAVRSEVRQYKINFKNFEVALCTSLLVLFVSQILVVAGAGDSYTDEELELLPKLLSRLDYDLTNDYMAENNYLVRFLRASELDLDAAEQMMRRNLQWRLENNMDDLIEDDFDELATKYPAYLAEDLEGRPALVGAGISQMNFRKTVINGKGPDALKFNYFYLDKTVERLFEVSNQTGTDFIGATFIFNLARYNTRIHGCSSCLPYFTQLVNSYENYYPRLGNKFILVNTPKIFEIVLKLVEPFMTAHTQQALKIYGFDKAEWRQELMKSFPASELTQEYGGKLL